MTSIAAQNYLTGTAVNFTLPAATGGNGDITYTLTGATLPAGLTFDAATRVLTGTPTTEATAQTYTYTAADADMTTGAGDEASLTVNIVVRAPAPPSPPTRLTLSIDPTMVTESATPTTITATVTFVGGTYTIARIVQVGLRSGRHRGSRALTSRR